MSATGDVVTGRRAFRFGVLVGPAPDMATWRRRAVRAEELGYSSLLVPDHLGQEWGPLVSLATAAGCTSRIALGTLMLAADLRSPAVLYKELATLDQAAPGRLEIGLGAGWYAPDFSRAGIAMDPPGTRIDRLEEAALIIRRLWDKGGCSYQGRYHSTVDAVGEPRPRPARWTMGGGGRRMLRTAVRHADIVSVSARLDSGGKDSGFGRSATAQQFDERLTWIRESAGDRIADLELQCLVFAAAVVSNPARYADRVLSRMFGLPAADALASPLALVGSVDEVSERLQAHRKRFGISYWVLPAAQMEQFAEVVDRLTGT